MGRGKRPSALSNAVAAARVVVAPRPDPRVGAELSRTFSTRTIASCWVALVIIPITIVAYDGAFYTDKLPKGIVAAAAVLLLTGGAKSEFVFPYYLIMFGIAILFPAPLPAVIGTVGLLPLGYLGLAVAAGGSLSDKKVVS